MLERSVGQREQYNQNAYRSTLLQPSKQTYTIPKVSEVISFGASVLVPSVCPRKRAI
jgi:hypothetical protein